MVWACAAKRWWLGEEMDGVWNTGSNTKRTWTEIVEKDCEACKLNKEDAMDHSKWRKLIKDARWSGQVLVCKCFFLLLAYPGSPGPKAINSCVCVLSVRITVSSLASCVQSKGISSGHNDPVKYEIMNIVLQTCTMPRFTYAALLICLTVMTMTIMRVIPITITNTVR